MRGLAVFIADIRNCRARELEERRINKELANIRSKFLEPNLSGYHRTKYVAKLIYMYITGWPVDFGHAEAITLLSSQKYHEKRMGYLAVTLLLTDNDDFIKLIVKAIKCDLSSLKETDNCLALCAIANMVWLCPLSKKCGKELAESFADDVMHLLVVNTKTFVKKKAALCLLRIMRKFPKSIALRDWAPKLIPIMNDPDFGVKITITTLLILCVQQSPDEFEDCLDIAVETLSQIIIENNCKPEYLYYKIPVPWLQVKLLRLLQYYPTIADARTLSNLNRVLEHIINSFEELPKHVQQANAQSGILFEAINLAIHLDAESDIVAQSTILLSRFISARETNLRYLGLDALAHLAGCLDSPDILKQHYETILISLCDKDISVRRRALDLLYSMCDFTNCKSIVKELLHNLSMAEYAIRAELVLKIAILTEKFSTDSAWYVDVTLKLILGAGDQVSDEIWHRATQVLSLEDVGIQAYAARSVMDSIQSPSSHESLLKLGAYILGEYGHLIAEEIGYQPIDQLSALQKKIKAASSVTRSLIMTTMLKFANLFPEIKPNIIDILYQYRHVLDVELQQRACEYHAILTLPTMEILEVVCDAMPVFEQQESSLLKRLQSKLADTEDKRTWLIGGMDINSSTKTSQVNIHHDSATRESPTSAAADKPEGIHNSLNPDNLVGRLCLNSSGILYEDANLQIGIKSEYHAQLGRVGVYFGNKCEWSLDNFLITCTTMTPSLKISVIQPVGDRIQAQRQECQMYNIECVAAFDIMPTLSISFESQGISRMVTVSLPVVMTKFVEAVDLTRNDFLGRWDQIGGPPREHCTAIPMDTCSPSLDIPSIVRSANFQIIPSIDATTSRCFDAAGIFNTLTFGKIGCLLNIEVEAAHLESVFILLH